MAPYVIVMFECCLLMYIFGAQRFSQNIEDMTGHKNSHWWAFNWKFLAPVLILVTDSCSVYTHSYRSLTLIDVIIITPTDQIREGYTGVTRQSVVRAVGLLLKCCVSNTFPGKIYAGTSFSICGLACPVNNSFCQKS